MRPLPQPADESVSRDPRAKEQGPPARWHAPAQRRSCAAASVAARQRGATDTRVGGSDVVEQVLELTDGFGADYTFEATGLVGVMRQAVESARMGWGLCTIAGVAGKGETLDNRP